MGWSVLGWLGWSVLRGGGCVLCLERWNSPVALRPPPSAPGSWHPAPGTRHPAPGTLHPPRCPSDSFSSDSPQCNRQMVDKRQCRRVNKASFVAAIDQWSEKQRQPAPKQVCTREPLSPLVQTEASRGTRRVRVIARKRPLFEHEAAKEEYDTVTVCGSKMLAVHQSSMQALETYLKSSTLEDHISPPA